MNIKQLKNAIKYLPSEMSIMLRGTHGIGKTEWVKQLAGELGLNLVIWHASHAADAGDLTGLPYKYEIECIDPETGKNHIEKVTRFAPPEWMLQEKPALVLLDEINRGMSIALNAIMQFTNDGTYDNIKLPKGSRIFACINPEADGKYDVSTLDPAQLSRFSVFDFNPTVEEWIEYMTDKYGINIVTEFISTNKQYLDPYTNAELVHSVQGKDSEMLPDRRKWEKVWLTIKNGIDDGNVWDSPEGTELLGNILHGMVGVSTALMFMEFYKNNKNRLNPEKVMTSDWNKKTEQTIKKMSQEDLPSSITFAKNCVYWIKEHETEFNEKNADNFYKVIDSMSKDVKTSICIDIIYKAMTTPSERGWVNSLCKLKPEIKTLVRDAKIINDV